MVAFFRDYHVAVHLAGTSQGGFDSGAPPTWLCLTTYDGPNARRQAAPAPPADPPVPHREYYRSMSGASSLVAVSIDGERGEICEACYHKRHPDLPINKDPVDFAAGETPIYDTDEWYLGGACRECKGVIPGYEPDEEEDEADDDASD